MSLQPAVFLSHGAPTAAIEQNTYSEALAHFGQQHASPEAIIVVSAHWQERWPVRVTSWAHAPLIYDFGGFPDELYRIQYPAPGQPKLAAEVVSLLKGSDIDSAVETKRGLDHGAWVPLSLTWPAANIPVLQVSLPMPASPEQILAIGLGLRPLRERGVLLMGSGGIVHNLRRVRLGGDPPPDDWAVQFDEWVQARLNERDFDSLLNYQRLGPHAELAQPTPEHFDPIFFVLGATANDDKLVVIYEGIRYGSLSLRSFCYESA